MPRKYNTAHPGRGRSNYGRRLAKRGLTKAPAMERLETLQDRQEKRKENTGVPWWTESNADTSAA